MNTQRPPHPYLTREETDEILEQLGFEFDERRLLKDSAGGRRRMMAIEKLIAGAITEWAGIEFDSPPTETDSKWNKEFAQTPEKVELELQEWAEEWLVG